MEPEITELPSAWGYSWANLSGGYKYGDKNTGEGQQQIDRAYKFRA
jgi:hypothetical protein